MKSLLTAIFCLAAVATAPAAETPNKFAGRWLAIVKPLPNQKSDVPIRRAILTFDVSDDGYTTNGVLRDFCGQPHAPLAARIEENGRAISDWPTSASGISLLVKLNLRKNTGTGTYKYYGTNAVYGRGIIECWRETWELPEPPSTNAIPALTSCDCLFDMQNVRTIPPRGVRFPPLPPTPLTPTRPDSTNIIQLPPLPLPNP